MFYSRVLLAAQKVSPELERELRRHVARNTAKKQTSKASANSSTRTTTSKSNAGPILAGCLALTGCALCMPYISMWWIGGLVRKEGELTAAQVRRGPFNNSGSRDAGRDPNWDFDTGTYKKDKKYQEMFDRDDPDKVDHGEEFFKRS